MKFFILSQCSWEEYTPQILCHEMAVTKASFDLLVKELTEETVKEMLLLIEQKVIHQMDCGIYEITLAVRNKLISRYGFKMVEFESKQGLWGGPIFDLLEKDHQKIDLDVDVVKLTSLAAKFNDDFSQEWDEEIYNRQRQNWVKRFGSKE